MLWFLVIILSAAACPLGAQAQPVADIQSLYRAAQFQKEGRHAEALAEYGAALDDLERRLGPQDITIAQVLVQIGALHALQHDDRGAKAAFDRSLVISEKVLGPEHVQVGFTLQTIAMLTHKQGHYAAAEPLYRRALTILQNNLGTKHERTAILEGSMAKLYLAQRRNGEAEALLEKAIPVLENAGDMDQAKLAVALSDLAGAYQRDGRFSKAGPLYARLWAIVQVKPQFLNADIRQGLRAYVQMLRKMNRKSDARQLDMQLKTMLPR